MKRDESQLNSYTLLGLDQYYGGVMEEDVQQIKRRRVDRDASLSIVGTNVLPTMQDAVVLGIQWTRFLAQHHTLLLSTLTATGSRGHYDASKMNPFSLVEESLKGIGVDIRKLHDDALTCPIEGGTMSVVDILGVVPRIMYLSALIELTKQRCVVNNPATANPLVCHYCRASSHLFTVAEEYKTACEHPHACSPGQEDVWAMDKETGTLPFQSSKNPQTLLRQGSAICFGCIYNQLIRRDDNLCSMLLTWYSFKAALDENLGATAPLHKLCHVYAPDHDGAVCLFCLSFVLGAEHATTASYLLHYTGPWDADRRHVIASDSVTEAVHFDQILSVRNLSKLFEAYLDTDAVSVPCESPTPLDIVQAKMDAQHADVQQLIHSLAYQHMVRDNQNLDDPATALAFLQRHAHVISLSYHAKMTLARHYGKKVLMFRERPDQQPMVCENCGGYGHDKIKSCAMLYNEKATPRGGQTLEDHYVENIQRTLEDQQHALEQAVALDAWESRQLINLATEAAERKASRKPYQRRGPSMGFIDRDKKPPSQTVTPSVEVATLADMNITQVQRCVNLKVLNSDMVEKTQRAWSNLGFDTSDFVTYQEWFAKEQCDSLQREKDDTRKTAFLQVVHSTLTDSSKNEEASLLDTNLL